MIVFYTYYVINMYKSLYLFKSFIDLFKMFTNMIKKSFRIRDHIVKNLKCNYKIKFDEQGDKFFEVDYLYKIANINIKHVTIKYINSHIKYTSTVFEDTNNNRIDHSHHGFCITNNLFWIFYKNNNKNTRFEQFREKQVKLYDYDVLITKIVNNGILKIPFENGENDNYRSYSIFRNNNILNIKQLTHEQTYRNIVNIFQLGEDHVYKIFNNIFINDSFYRIVSNDTLPENFGCYANLDDMFSKVFYTDISFEQSILKMYCVCCYGDYNVSFTFDYQTNEVDYTQINTPDLKIIWNLCDKICNVIYKQNNYDFRISSKGYLIGNNDNISKNSFINLDQLIYYFSK